MNTKIRRQLRAAKRRIAAAARQVEAGRLRAADADRRQHPVRVGRADARHGLRRHRRDRAAGPRTRSGRSDRPPLASVEDSPALSRERPRAQPRLQRPVRRHLPGRSSNCAATTKSILDALGARRIPDPTTAGDFCRRFSRIDVRTLLDVFNDTRHKVWAEQPAEFFDEASIDMDGTLVATDGRVQSGAWTSPTTAPGAIIRWWCRWPTPARC